MDLIKNKLSNPPVGWFNTMFDDNPQQFQIAYSITQTISLDIGTSYIRLQSFLEKWS